MKHCNKIIEEKKGIERNKCGESGVKMGLSEGRLVVCLISIYK